MSTTFVTTNLWRQLTAAAKQRAGTALVAVPYFSARGPSLLPLRAGSRLVVNASEAAVQSGQTSPHALRVLQRKGVRIYSREDLHAKVYVFGSTAFVGSANASVSSATHWIEAVVATRDRATVAAARQFVQGLCEVALGPEELARLAEHYRAPQRTPKSRGPRRAGPQPRRRSVWIAQVAEDELPSAAAPAHERGLRRARALRSQRTHVVEDFWCSGPVGYGKGDILVEVFAQADGTIWVSPPGRVLLAKRWRGGRRHKTFVYFERPSGRRIRLERLAKQLGRGAKAWLQRDGRLPDNAFRERLMAAFDRGRP